MNKKGFTLVELLAVIVILSLLALLTSNAVTKLVKDSKNDLYDNQILLIKEAAETWGADNLYRLPDKGKCAILTLKDLKQYGILDSSIINPKTNEEFSDYLKIKISTQEGDYGNLVTTYEINPTSVMGCEILYKSVCVAVNSTNATSKGNTGIYTIGNIPTANTYNKGDEYICNVDGSTEYHFYLLGTSGDYVNLILDRNISSFGSIDISESTPWISKNDYILSGGNEVDYSTGNVDRGPITLMNYISTATKSWINIPNITINYTDAERGYGSIITNGDTTTITASDGTSTATYKNLKARLPYLSEVSGLTGLWLYDYTTYASDSGGHTGALDGYWLLSSSNSANSSYAYVKTLSNPSATSIDNNIDYGVRPVITLKKTSLYVPFLGDVNGDGTLTQDDMSLLVKWVNQGSDAEVVIENIDTNSDNIIDATDFSKIVQLIG